MGNYSDNNNDILIYLALNEFSGSFRRRIDGVKNEGPQTVLKCSTKWVLETWGENYKLLTQAAHTIHVEGVSSFVLQVHWDDWPSQFQSEDIFLLWTHFNVNSKQAFLADTNNGVSAETFNGLSLRKKLAWGLINKS